MRYIGMHNHLYLRGGIYYYNRRVPSKFLPYVGKRVVCISLETDSHTIARRLSALKTAQLEEYWNLLASTGQTHQQDLFLQTVKRANVYGFTYVPIDKLSAGCALELAKRVNFVAQQKFQPLAAEAVLGSVEEPVIRIKEALEIFWRVTADIKLNKSESEYRKWQNPRQLAIKNFINVNGNIAIKDVDRERMRRFKEWWALKIEDGYSPASANKNFRHVKAVITTVAAESGFKFSYEQIKDIYGNLEFDDSYYEPRKPFSTAFITDTLLNGATLEGLREYEVAMIKVMSETGISISEMVKIMPEDINLKGPYPYVEIKPRVKMLLKTKHRRRRMPLVGYALEALQKFPHGFRAYEQDADTISNRINSHLRGKKIFPTEKHSLYSLRHSFQDRLTNSRCPERIQVDLMGHKFSREKYGEGGSLQTLHSVVSEIQLKSVKF